VISSPAEVTVTHEVTLTVIGMPFMLLVIETGPTAS
jgi:hypothetical protein